MVAMGKPDLSTDSVVRLVNNRLREQRDRKTCDRQSPAIVLWEHVSNEALTYVLQWLTVVTVVGSDVGDVVALLQTSVSLDWDNDERNSQLYSLQLSLNSSLTVQQRLGGRSQVLYWTNETNSLKLLKTIEFEMTYDSSELNFHWIHTNFRNND